MTDPTVIMIAALSVPVLAFALLIWAFIATKLKLRKPYCRDCGADLGPDVGETCPECGELLVQPEEEDELLAAGNDGES
ncbi:MAG: hypothetical protein MPJ50_16240 [Pirellulales bacterium]|nr:hypothetical protein [Pirellulales bacterium]